MGGVWLVVAPATRDERVVRLNDRVHIGRECAGIAPAQRILLDDPAVSRDHAEVLIIGGTAFLVDRSTNGTRVNGRRVEQGERVPLVDGDRLTVGDSEIMLRTTAIVLEPDDDSRRTITAESVEECVVLVGDVVGYTRLTEMHGAAAVAGAVDGLFTELRRVVAGYHGTVSNFAGDAILAVWEQSAAPGAAASAISCVVAAHQYASEAATLTPVRYEDGESIRIGWSVTSGAVATSHPSPARMTVHGDAVNLAFRLAGLAGRAEIAPILVDAEVAEVAVAAATFGEPFEVTVKGRHAPARVRPITA